MLLIVEDLHWIDPSTLELLALLIDQVPTASILILLSSRPGFQAPWGHRSQITPINLQRLTYSQSGELVSRVTGDEPLPPEVVEQLVTKADGVPLYLEEMTKAVLESDLLAKADGHFILTGPLPDLVIPATLHDSLMARLDRLVTAKGVAQFGAVIGRQFSYTLLQALSRLDDDTLQRELDRLVDAELVYQRGVPPQSTYIFKHALIQDAAYESLLKRTRQQYHQQIAAIIVTQFTEIADSQPELLAHHYTEAGLAAQALPYWQQAGNRANGRSAHAEAEAHLKQGLEVLKALPETPERVKQELALHLSLGPTLLAIKGQHATEVEQVYTRARELSQLVGETAQLVSALNGMYRHHIVRGEMLRTRELGEELLQLATNRNEPLLQLAAHALLGAPLLWSGDVVAAHDHFEASSAGYNPDQHREFALRYGLDPVLAGVANTAVTSWGLGHIDQARHRAHHALTLAHGHAQPLSRAHVTSLVSMFYCFIGDYRSALEQAEAIIALSTEHGFPFWVLTGQFLRGLALLGLGERDDNPQPLQHATDQWREAGMELFSPQLLACLAEAYLRSGQAEFGQTQLDLAKTIMTRNDERLWESEIHRLQGEFCLAGLVPDPDEAETFFRQALETARRQCIKPWELRSAMSLAQLWREQGKRDEARELLVPIYGWFSEGFDTTDLEEAKALLDTLVEAS